MLRQALPGSAGCAEASKMAGMSGPEAFSMISMVYNGFGEIS